MKRLRSLLSRTPRVTIERGPAANQAAKAGRYLAYVLVAVAVFGGFLSIWGFLQGEAPVEEAIPVGPPPTTTPPPAYDMPAGRWGECLEVYLRAPSGSDLFPAWCWGPDRPVLAPPSNRIFSAVKFAGYASPEDTGTARDALRKYRICYVVENLDGTRPVWVMAVDHPSRGEPVATGIAHAGEIDPALPCPAGEAETTAAEEAAAAAAFEIDEDQRSLIGDFLRWCHPGEGEPDAGLERTVSADFDGECPRPGTLDDRPAIVRSESAGEGAEVFRVSYLVDGLPQTWWVSMQLTGGRWEVSAIRPDIDWSGR